MLAGCDADEPAQVEMSMRCVADKPRGRRKVWAADGQETPSEIKALIGRMMLGRGPPVSEKLPPK